VYYCSIESSSKDPSHLWALRAARFDEGRVSAANKKKREKANTKGLWVIMAQARALEGQMCQECSGWIRRRGRGLRIVDSPSADGYRAVEPPALYFITFS